jgi:uncharacterized membrane protein YedE/YeeE
MRAGLLPAFLALAGCAFLILQAGWHSVSWRGSALGVVGVGLGFVLFQSTFGFAGSFRAALEQRDFTGFRAQAVALAVASIIFFPLLAQSSAFGADLNGFSAPIGVAFVIGAIMFGLGMQLGGGCASGTLFALGGGNLRLFVTLAFFVAGSAIGAAHLDFWRGLPKFEAITSQEIFGWPLALALHLAIFGSIIRLIPRGADEPRPKNIRDFLCRPWPLLWGAVGLGLLNASTLLIAGRPWGETSGFTLWGSKVALNLGFDPASWPYWRGDPAPLSASLFSDITTVMDFGIILGALLASGLSNRFSLRRVGHSGVWFGASAGGLLMGYGARLSDGCNIGAYFSALASGSLSAWVWVAGAFAGSAIGLKLRSVLSLP